MSSLTPIELPKVFSDQRFEEILLLINNLMSNTQKNNSQRTLIQDLQDDSLLSIGSECLNLAKEIFGKDNLVPAQTMFAHYEGIHGFLAKHVDVEKNLYLIDVGIYQDKPWGIFVSGKEYLLQPNSGLAFPSGQLEHWREQKDPDNTVGVLLIYYLEENV